MSSALDKLRELRERREKAAAAAQAKSKATQAQGSEAHGDGDEGAARDAAIASNSVDADSARVMSPQPPPPSSAALSPLCIPPSFQSPASAVLKYRDGATDALAGVVTARSVAAAVAESLAVLPNHPSPPNGHEESAATGQKRCREEDEEEADPPPTRRFLVACVANGRAVFLEKPKTAAEIAALSSAERYEYECRHARLDVSGSSRPRCRDVNGYLRKDCIAQGVYGVVFSATEAGTGRVFALKHIKKQWLEESQIGFPPYLLREFDLLLRLRHPNIVCARELVVLGPDPLPMKKKAKSEDAEAKDADAPDAKPCPLSSPLNRSAAKDVFLVMEYCPFDLKNYMLRYSARAPYQPYLHVTSRSRGCPEVEANFLARVKGIAAQLFRGLAFLHTHRILHRDVKTSNVLLDKHGVVKVCDFGLGRHYREGQHLTPTVVTLMYRAPELHLGLTDYSHKMDVWSMGCVVAELFLKAPLFRAAEEQQHLLAVCDILGMPSEESFPGVYKLPRAKEALRAMGRWNRTNRLAEVFYGSNDDSKEQQDGGGSGSSTTATTTTTKANDATQGGGPCSGRKASCYDARLLPASGLDLLQRIFAWNPADRPSAAEVLEHRFFHEAPLPCSPEELTRPMPSASRRSDGSGRSSPSEKTAMAAPLPPTRRRSGDSASPPLVHVRDMEEEADSVPRAGEAEEGQGVPTSSPSDPGTAEEDASLTYSNAVSPVGESGPAATTAAEGGAMAGGDSSGGGRGAVDDVLAPAMSEADAEWQAKQRAQLLANQDVDD